MTPDRFLGTWRVSEYVFDPDGAPVGVIRQVRSLERLSNGRTRVVQRMTPSPSLAGHPMAAFAGEWVFDLAVDGRARRYLGPDVIGAGLTWGEGTTTGRGVWPRFGHTFTSFSVLTAPGRQLTGGAFFNAGEMVANIIGVATLADGPEIDSGDSAFPELVAPFDPAEVAPRWHGVVRACGPDGAVLAETQLERRNAPDGFAESTGLKLSQDARGPRFVCAVEAELVEALHGVAKRTGWQFELEAHGPGGTTLELMEVLDSAAGALVSLRRWRRDDVLVRVDVARLTADLA